MSESIFDKGVLVYVNSSVWSGKITIPTSQVNSNVDREFFQVSKRLINKEALKQIEHARSAARNYAYANTLPFPIPGMLFVPNAMIEEMDRELQRFKVQFNSAVDRFVEHYDFYVSNAKERLGELFNQNDYPTNIRDKFDLNWKFATLDTLNEGLKQVSPALVAEENRKFRQMANDFRTEAVFALRAKFAELVERACERLKNPDNKFKNSLVGNFQEFLTTFDKLNINEDKDLENSIGKLKKFLDGVDPKDLRKDMNFRQEIYEKFEEINKDIDTFFENRPSRLIQVDTEPEMELVLDGEVSE